MNEPPNQSLQWIAASRRPLSFIVNGDDGFFPCHQLVGPVFDSCDTSTNDPRGTKESLHGRRLQEMANARLMGCGGIRRIMTRLVRVVSLRQAISPPHEIASLLP